MHSQKAYLKIQKSILVNLGLMKVGHFQKNDKH